MNKDKYMKNWKQWIPFYGVPTISNAFSLLWQATICAFILILFANKCHAQGQWILVETQTYVMTSITFDSVGNMWTTTQQGDTYENGLWANHINCLFDNELGLETVVRAGNHIYYHYTGQDTVQRVVRITSGNPVLDTLFEVSYKEPLHTPPYSSRHVGGGLVVVGDTMLYAGFGVGGYPNSAQDLNSLRGKIMAYNLKTNASYILAYGCRNPFRIAYDEQYNDLWFGDPGTNIAEELNIIQLDVDTLVDFGYPCFEGVQENADTCMQEPIFPVYWYTQPVSRAVIGGDMYDNNYYWTDYVSGNGGYIDSMWNNNNLTTPTGITCMAVNNTDKHLYACAWTGKIYRYDPDTIVLALPDTIPIHKHHKHKDYTPEFIQEMIQLYGGDWYCTLNGEWFKGYPSIPGYYYRLAEDKLIFVKP